VKQSQRVQKKKTVFWNWMS